jgi:hypothetical protein
MKTTNYIGILAIVAITTFGAIEIAPSVVFAVASTPGAVGSNAPESVAPVSVGSNAPEAAAPVNQGTNGNDAGIIPPVNQGSNGNDAGAILPVNQGANGDDANTPPITPPVTPPGGGGGGGSSGSSGSFTGGGSSSGGSSIYPLVLGVNAGTSTCPLITSFMKFGANNDTANVVRLQSFLKNSQELDVTVNGIFDQQTENAVRAFQEKNLSTVMEPWGATQSSGFVYITTVKEINRIACNSPFTLSASDISIIDAYKARLATGEINNTTGTSSTGPVLETGSSTATTSPDIGSDVSTSQTGAVGNVSILTRFWNFIIGLFR